MKKINKNGVNCYSDFWILPSGFSAITLFGNVFFRKSYDDLVKYLESSTGEVTINHERIHLLQSNKLGYFKFYVLYIWYWFIGLFKYGVQNNRSYYNIPFEREAYRNQYDMNYSETNWEQYK